MRSLPYMLISLATFLACGEPGPEPDPYQLPDPDRLSWLWVGPYSDRPPCPQYRLMYWQGWTEGVVECNGCTCGPAACALPSRVTAHASICPDDDDDGVEVAFDAGTGWDGSCVALPPPASSSAVASVAFEPPTLSPCEALPPPNARKMVLACPYISDKAPATLFTLCADPEPDGTCPSGFSDRRIYTEKPNDEPDCPPCECDAPTGGNCVADVHLYAGATCDNPIAAEALGLGLGDRQCADTSAPSPFRAVRAEFTQADAGTCSPRSVPPEFLEPAKLGESRVFCCTQ